MTNLKRLFVLAAALFLALGPIGDGMASAQTDEIVGIEISHPAKARAPNSLPFTRFAIDRVISSAEGVTVDLTANTVRLGPGKYWFAFGVHPEFLREIPAVPGEDSTGTTVEIMRLYLYGGAGTLVVVDDDGATGDDVKLGTVGRRVDFYCCDGLYSGNFRRRLTILRLGD